MYKLKRKKSATKRFVANKNGKIKKANSFKNHLLTKKKHNRKRNLRGMKQVHIVNKGVIKKMLGI